MISAAAFAGDLRHALALDLGVRLEAEAEEPAHDLLLDGRGQSLEHLEAFTLVGDDRVLLRVGAQTDALTQIVHRIDVIHPVFIDHAKRDDALDLAHDGGRILLLLGSVEAVHELHQLFFGLLLREGLQLVLRDLPAALRQIDALDMAHHFGELRKVAEVLLLAEGGVDDPVDHEADHGLNAGVQILSVEHLTALLVDDLSLDVHDVVVFQNALTHLIVAAFDGFLCVLDGAGEDLRVDGCVLVDTKTVHHAENALRAEQTHDVILHG